MDYPDVIQSGFYILRGNGELVVAPVVIQRRSSRFVHDLYFQRSRFFQPQQTASQLNRILELLLLWSCLL
ncbi:hypothetical protein D9M68_888040 [compost metagenome]